MYTERTLKSRYSPEALNKLEKTVVLRIKNAILDIGDYYAFSYSYLEDVKHGNIINGFVNIMKGFAAKYVCMLPLSWYIQ